MAWHNDGCTVSITLALPNRASQKAFCDQVATASGVFAFLAQMLRTPITMKALHSILRLFALIPILVLLWQVDGFAASLREDTAVLDRVVYVILAVAIVCAVVFIFFGNVLTSFLGRLGNSSADERGPKAGDGAVIHDSSGEADFNGSSGTVPTRDADRDFSSRPRKST